MPAEQPTPAALSSLAVTTDGLSMSHSLDGGIELVHRAEDSGDWKPVADWLAQHPEQGQALGEYLATQRGLRKAAITLRASSPELAGTSVGRFVLREEIGRGGAGVVYKAVDAKLERDVAVKLVRTGEAAPTDLDRFRFEAKVVASLRHPNIVQILEYEEDGSVPYLVMPLMDGSLEKKLKALGPDRRLPQREAARLVRDIARGVDHAHQRGLIHRDLKPGNILLDEVGTPHVADFGLAKRVDVTLSDAGPIAGTVLYMAPEQARGDAGLTTAVDVHALGAVLFELLTGRTPFAGGNAQAVLERVKNDPAPGIRQKDFRPDADRDLEAICLKCLDKLPEARYGSARELADDLDRYLRGDAVTARPPGVWDWLKQLARTYPEPGSNYNWPVTIWFGIAVLAAGVAVYLLARAGGSARDVWLVNVGAVVTMGFVLWWYMLRRFRTLPVTERHSLIIAAGKLIAYVPLMLAYVPLSASVSARAALAMYPALGALSGMAFFVLGSTNWSRFFPVGLGVMALTPVMAYWPEESPLVYGAGIAFVLWYWAGVKKDGFRPRPAAPK